jgi:large subunit ribosomal protein L21
MIKLAVVQTGGKQYLVKPGQSLRVEKLNAKIGENFSFDKVLLMADAQDVKIGMPYIEGAKVSAKIEREGRGKKVTILKYKPKTRYRLKKGHRQPFTQIKISNF